MNPLRMNIRLAICFLFCVIPSSVVAQQAPQEIPLWPNGAPGFENRRGEPPVAKDYWVANIHNPTLTIYLPAKEKATGAAVVVCPGGGHSKLVFTAEGDEPARYLANIGVTAFVLKYRLGREQGSPYSIEKHARQDGERAMRLVRSRAREWNLDPKRIGMMGFSAGGEVVSMVAFSTGKGDPNAAEEIDRADARPDFIIMIYPGPLFIPDVVSASAPPAFLIAATDDECCSPPVVKLLQRYRDAKVSVEAHIYAQGSHAFNMGYRSKLASIKSWPQRMVDWLADNHFLEPAR